MASSYSQPITVCISLAILRIFLRFWTAYFLIYFLLVKECFDALLWVFIKFKEKIIRIVQQISIENIWTDVLEEVKNNHVNSLFFKDSTPKNIAQSQLIHNSPLSEKKYEMYMCESCRSINRYFINCKYFKFKTPNILKNVSPTEKCNSCSSPELFRTVSEPHLSFQNEFSANILQKESFESLEKSDLRSNNIKLRTLQLQDVVYHSPESQNSSNDSIENIQIRNKNSTFYKSNEKINQNEMQSIKPETHFKETNLKTPTESEVDLSLETPPSKFNFLRRESKLRLMLSKNKYTSKILPEDSLFKKIWDKWFSRRNPVTFLDLKQNANKIPLTSTIPGQVFGLRKTANKPQMVEHGESFLSNNQTPKKKHSCTNMFINLKSRFNPNFNEGSVSYHRF